jgi:hypothetical protein
VSARDRDGNFKLGAQESIRQPIAGRYDNPIPTPFLAHINCSKIPAEEKGGLIKAKGWKKKIDKKQSSEKLSSPVIGCFSFLLNQISSLCALLSLPPLFKTLTILKSSPTKMFNCKSLKTLSCVCHNLRNHIRLSLCNSVDAQCVYEKGGQANFLLIRKSHIQIVYV